MNIYKKWLFKVLALSFVLIGISAVLGKTALIVPVYDVKLFQLDKDIDTLIIGASHAVAALDPHFFKRTESIARNGEPLFFTYYKTKRLLERNNNIKTLILSFSPIQISKYHDYLFVSGMPECRANLMDYFFLMDDTGRRYFKKLSPEYMIVTAKYDFGLPLSFLDDVRVIARYYLNKIDYRAYKFWGGYHRVFGVHLEDKVIKKKIAYYFYGNDKKFKESDVAIEHIKKIAKICSEKSVKLILVNTPKHKNFMSEVPPFYHLKHEEVIRDIKNTNPDVKYYDFSYLVLPDEYYFDGDHLNNQGGEKFSEMLANLLRNKTTVN